MSQILQHMGKGTIIHIKEDGIGDIVLLPLTIKELPLFFKVAKAFSGQDQDSEIGDLMTNMEEDVVNAMVKMIEITIDRSFSNEADRDKRDTLKEMKYFSVLLPEIIKMNSATTTNVEVTKKETIKQRLKAQRKKQ